MRVMQSLPVRNVRTILKRYKMPLCAFLFAVWVWGWYGFTVRLPFFFDDLPIMTWVANHSWLDMIFSHENAYYRPLVFLIYKWGQLFPMGLRQPILHTINPLLLWLDMVLILKVVYLCEQRFDAAFLSAFLFGGFPFLMEPVPWVTALPHLLVTFLALFAIYTALLGEFTYRLHYWVVSLVTIALAPLAHENGAVVGVLVGGLVVMRFGVNVLRRRWLFLFIGVALNSALILSRLLLPGVYAIVDVKGIPDIFSNSMYFLHGLLYPLGPIIGSLVRNQQWHDFTLLGVCAVLLSVVVAVLVYKKRYGAWVVRSLWWWLVASAPSIVSLDYGSLFVGKRFYTFPGVGITMFWAMCLIQIVENFAPRRIRITLIAILSALLLTQSAYYLQHIRSLYDILDGVYAEVLTTVEDEQRGPFGFINIPAALIWQNQVYALVKDDVIFVPQSYSNLSEFIEVNYSNRRVDVASSQALFRKTEPLAWVQGEWLTDIEMREFVMKHQITRVARFEMPTRRFVLEDIGNVFPDAEASMTPVARFESGVVLEYCNVNPTDVAERWQIILGWWTPAPQDATVFVHVRDANGVVVTQADGPLLDGTVAFSALQPGDEIRDVRYVTLPANVAGPFSVFVGLYRDVYRFPAFVAGMRVPDDSVWVGQIPASLR